MIGLRFAGEAVASNWSVGIFMPITDIQQDVKKLTGTDIHMWAPNKHTNKKLARHPYNYVYLRPQMCFLNLLLSNYVWKFLWPKLSHDFNKNENSGESFYENLDTHFKKEVAKFKIKSEITYVWITKSKLFNTSLA